MTSLLSMLLMTALAPVSAPLHASSSSSLSQSSDASGLFSHGQAQLQSRRELNRQRASQSGALSHSGASGLHQAVFSFS